MKYMHRIKPSGYFTFHTQSCFTFYCISMMTSFSINEVCVTGTDVSLIKLLFLLSPVQPKSGHWKMSPVWWRTWGMYQTQICEICYIVDRSQFTKVFHQIEMLNVASCLQVGAVIQFLNCGVIKYLFSMAHHTALDG